MTHQIVPTSNPSPVPWARPVAKPVRPARLAMVCASLLISACADFSGITPMSQALRPESLGLRAVQLPAPAPEGARSASTEPKEGVFDQNWWHSFQDPRLDALVARALESHPLAQDRTDSDCPRPGGDPGPGGQ